MSRSPTDRCKYVWPENFIEDPIIINQQHCCYRETYEDSDRCIFHSALQEVSSKPAEELKKARAPPEIRDLNKPYTELLNGAVLPELRLEDNISFEGVCLRDAELKNTNLSDANLSGADLFNANMNEATVLGANLTDAHLESTDVKDATFSRANLSGAKVQVMELEDVRFADANLTNVSFQETIFDNVILRGADLSGANMRYVEVRRVNINHETTIGRQTRAEENAHTATSWDLIAQAHHEFKSMFSEHGFVKKARNQYFWERRARGLQAKAASNRFDGWFNLTYLGSLASRLFTGYGVRVSYLVGWMAILFLFSTFWYVLVGVEDAILNNFTYSVIAFTAAPPNIPSESLTQLMVMAETFLGTLLIVLLGYILGNREQF